MGCCDKLALMPEPIFMRTVEKDGGLIVSFSDGTTAGYVAEELLKLRPHREPIEAEHEKVHK
jgi:hypothetical protein